MAELGGRANVTGDGSELANFRPLDLCHVGRVRCEARPPAVRALSLFHVDDSNPPFFVGHSLDESIPLSQSPRLARALREHSIDSTFVTVKSRWAANLSARSGWTPRR